MTVLWPVVRDRLVAVVPTLAAFAGVTVYNGPVPTGAAPSSYMTVGWQPSSEDESAGTFTQDEGPDGYRVLEAGAILCELAVSTGGTTLPDVFVLYSALRTWLEDSRTLGVLDPTAVVTVEAEVVQEQTTAGAVQRLRLSVIYQAPAT